MKTILIKLTLGCSLFVFAQSSLHAQTNQTKVQGIDYNKNSKQGENPAVHDTKTPAEPKKEYVNHPQNTKVTAAPVKGGAKVNVTIPIDKPKPGAVMAK